MTCRNAGSGCHASSQLLVPLVLGRGQQVRATRDFVQPQGLRLQSRGLRPLDLHFAPLQKLQFCSGPVVSVPPKQLICSLQVYRAWTRMCGSALDMEQCRAPLLQQGSDGRCLPTSQHQSIPGPESVCGRCAVGRLWVPMNLCLRIDVPSSTDESVPRPGA